MKLSRRFNPARLIVDRFVDLSNIMDTFSYPYEVTPCLRSFSTNNRMFTVNYFLTNYNLGKAWWTRDAFFPFLSDEISQLNLL